MSKDIKKAYEWAIKQNLKYLKNNNVSTGQSYINISNLLKNAFTEGYLINYEELKEEVKNEYRRQNG